MKHWEGFMTSINVRLRVAKLRFNQILEYSHLCALHNLSKEKKRREKVILGSCFYN